LILVDPGIDGSDLNQLADDVDPAGHSGGRRPAGAQAAREARERAQSMAAESASGIPSSR
jgi:hypothetical protein